MLNIDDDSPMIPIPFIDQCQEMTDNELLRECANLNRDRKNMLNDTFHQSENIYHIENDIAYIQRELQIRAARRKSHDSYEKSLKKQNVIDGVSENELPCADLDNSAYVNVSL